MSISNTITENISSYHVQSIDPKRQDRYMLCLRFVKQVASDFTDINSSHADQLFDQLGIVACCIDSYVDELPMQSKYLLQDTFAEFFDSLRSIDDVHQFQMMCLNYRTAELDMAEQQCSYHSLYSFYNKCRDVGLLDELKDFSMCILNCSILKHQAKNAKDMLTAVQVEGKASVEFLNLYLIKSGICKENSAAVNMKKYFYKLERIINLSDQLWDSTMDKKEGIIQLPLNLSFYAEMGSELLGAIIKTWIRHPYHFTKHFFQFGSRALALELK
ncbi:MAG: hypothetical protein JXR19_04065 [Bacteroidia bacterium]